MTELQITQEIHSVSEWPEEYLEFIELFNAGQFYDAHEVLEDIWVIEVDPLKTFYKGLIQLAGAFWHWERGNKSSAMNLMRSCEHHLSLYPPTYEGLRIKEILRQARLVMESSFDKAKEAAPNLIHHPNIPVLELTDGTPASHF